MAATKGSVTDTAGDTLIGTHTIVSNPSELQIDGTWTGGQVRLETVNLQGGGYIVVFNHERVIGGQKLDRVIITPDPAVLHRVIATDIVGTVNISFGP